MAGGWHLWDRDQTPIPDSERIVPEEVLVVGEGIVGAVWLTFGLLIALSTGFGDWSHGDSPSWALTALWALPILATVVYVARRLVSRRPRTVLALATAAIAGLWLAALSAVSSA